MVRPALTLALLLSLVAVISCGGARKTSDPGPRGTLRFECEPHDAILEVDETLLGPASMFEENGLLLKPGTHRVILRLDGHFPEHDMVEIVEGQVVVLKKALRKIPD